MARNYSNVAEETSLTTGINSSATSITVGSNTGYPSVPYTVIIDPGLATEEVCEVTAVAGTTWTITRGVDGTPASSHDTSAVVVHGYSARDLRDIQDHIGDSTGVHGLGGSSTVIGTTDTQTMTNKTLTAPTINGGTINSVTFGSGLTFTSPILTTPTIADFTNATHTHEDDASGGELSSGGGAAGLAYKRTASSTDDVSIVSGGDGGAKAVDFGTLDYNVGGNATWAVNGSNNRITLPTDVADAVWQVTANVQMNLADPATQMAFISIVHQDDGVIASATSGDDFGDSVVIRKMSCSAEFQALAGRWVEVRLGSMSGGAEFSVAARSVSISRVA